MVDITALTGGAGSLVEESGDVSSGTWNMDEFGEA
jgi:hypothetical protein